MTTRAEWRERILEELGGEGVDSDLTERDLDSSLRRALGLWSRYRPFLKWFPFTLAATETIVSTFFARPENLEWARVLEVQFADRDRRVNGGRIGPVASYRFRGGYAGPRTSFELQVGERTYERLTGSRPDWQWDPDTRKLMFTVPARDSRAMVLASRPRKLEEIPYDAEEEFLKVAVAAAKARLARILGSRTVGGGIPGPYGPIQTDAAELRKESIEEWEEVHKRLRTALVSFPPPGWAG